MPTDSPTKPTVFISHSSLDNDFANALAARLRGNGIDVWIDDRELPPGRPLEPDITKALDSCDSVIAILSANSRNSEWVAKEIRYALDLQKTPLNPPASGGKTESVRPVVIPLLLPDVTYEDLGHWFDTEPVGLSLEMEPGELDIAVPAIVQAITEQRKLYLPSPTTIESEKVVELVLHLSEPEMREEGGTRRATSKARLTYQPLDGTAPQAHSRPFVFHAPIGPIEVKELRWYLELYWRWPTGVYKDRAERIEGQMPEWGTLLYHAMHPKSAEEVFGTWRYGAGNAPHGFTVVIDSGLTDDAPADLKARTAEAEVQLFSLPWELLHDGSNYLFQGAHRVRVRRQMMRTTPQPPVITKPPIRVLMVSPRPEDAVAAYIDHRISVKPVVEALAPLGDLARLTILSPPTFPAMVEKLAEAAKAGEPYHVLHFDGHGVFDHEHGVGALCFEDPGSVGAAYERQSELVFADKIAEAVQQHRVPLVFLEACQSAQSDTRVEASVAGTLLKCGVASVVAMTHSVLVETAKRFVEAFYRSLLQGECIGQAMVAGQTALRTHPFRHKTMDGPLHLQDWFVPVLYQEEHDPQLIQRIHHPHVQQHLEEERKKKLGSLPEPPEQTFVGRSRELLAAERMLVSQRYVTIRGEGGEGKTTMAAELARWLTATHRFERVAFAAFDRVTTADAALSAIGNQLVPNFESRAGEQQDRGLGEVRRALVERRTLLVLDNLETVLPPPEGAPGAASFDPDALADLLALFATLRDASPQTRLLFTSREPLPPPFDRAPIALGRMAKPDAIDLVARTLAASGHFSTAANEKENDAAIERLVDAVNCHARALVLIAREVALSGLATAAVRLDEIMASLQEKYGDDRERSLLASVRLSLDRLPADVRELIRPLGVCVDGISLTALAHVLQEDEPTARRIYGALVEVGLAGNYNPGYLRFDPALGPALRLEMSVEEIEVAREAWMQTMAMVALVLYRSCISDAQRTFALVALELPNLLAALEVISREASPEVVVEFAMFLEDFAQHLGRPLAVRQAEQIRAQAAEKLGEWSQTAFNATDVAIDRLLDSGRFAEAAAAAQVLMQRCLEAGEDAYEGAAYNIAMVHLKVGRALRLAGSAAFAVAPLLEAEQRFERLAAEGNNDARRMASVARTDRADCLTDLKQYDAAAKLYEQSIANAVARDDVRSISANRFQLGTVRLHQNRYNEALMAYGEMRDISEKLGEPRNVGTAWHQIGMTYQEAGDPTRAEEAYQSSLGISRFLGDRYREASTLNQLGLLYRNIGRHQEAVRFNSQAADIYAESGDLANENRARTNAANALIALGKYEDARRELLRIIEYKVLPGHTAESWKIFDMLYEVERAVGKEKEAQHARQQAIAAYIDYRRDGGMSQVNGWPLLEAVGQAVGEGNERAIAQHIVALQTNMDDDARYMCAALLKVLAGSRDMALAEDPGLYYMDAVELRLLLESLPPLSASKRGRNSLVRLLRVLFARKA